MTKTVSKMTAADETDTLSSFIAASRDNDLDLIEKMIESNKSLINTADEEKRTALHWAVDREHIEMMKLLLQSGADPNCVDIDGCTVLHYAATAESETMITALIEAGASKELVDIDGNKPSNYT